jgi:hypothetical protein
MEYAFPNEYFDRNFDGVRSRPGMTLRDYFAAQALAGMLARYDAGKEDMAVYAYEHADAMLKARDGG